MSPSAKPVSIKDVARAAGVSHSTVSRALADSPLVAADTRQRIQLIAREMGYIPSAIARGLVTRRTATIGLVVTTIADPFIAEVVRGIEETALDSDYSVILCDSDADPERELTCVRTLREKRVDAIIVTSSRVGSLYVPLLEQLGVPIVLINNQHEGRYVYSVRNDDRQGGWLAGKYLASLGHRRIAYVGGPPDAHSSVERLEGCRAALREHGLDIPGALALPGDGRTGGGQAGAALLLQRAPHPTAVFCYNDMTAIGALQTAKAAGLRVPGDLSLVGYDDIAFAVFVDPPLTTVAQAKHTLGQRAMDLALDILDGQGETGDIVLTPHLVERASCAPPTPGGAGAS
jgi:DNA-binding LacI/PurR family transcriptional regulator